MGRSRPGVAAALTAVAMLVTACGGSSGSTDTSSDSASPTADPAAVAALIVTPANSRHADGPDTIQENGVHRHFVVGGLPLEVMDAYRSALEMAGWTVTVERSGGDAGGGGATYTGTKGAAYGVFDGGGHGTTTDIDSCVWPSQPTNTECGRGR